MLCCLFITYSPANTLYTPSCTIHKPKDYWCFLNQLLQQKAADCWNSEFDQKMSIVKKRIMERCSGYFIWVEDPMWCASLSSVLIPMIRPFFVPLQESHMVKQIWVSDIKYEMLKWKCKSNLKHVENICQYSEMVSFSLQCKISLKSKSIQRGLQFIKFRMLLCVQPLDTKRTRQLNQLIFVVVVVYEDLYEWLSTN